MRKEGRHGPLSDDDKDTLGIAVKVSQRRASIDPRLTLSWPSLHLLPTLAHCLGARALAEQKLSPCHCRVLCYLCRGGSCAVSACSPKGGHLPQIRPKMHLPYGLWPKQAAYKAIKKAECRSLRAHADSRYPYARQQTSSHNNPCHDPISFQDQAAFLTSLNNTMFKWTKSNVKLAVEVCSL